VNLTVRHRVRHGETLRSIAAEYSVSARALAAANGISRNHPLKRGTLLTVPASLHPPVPQVIEPAQDPRASTAYVPGRKIGLPARIEGNSSASDRVNHIVRRGETLDQIASQYGVTSAQIKTWNHLGNAPLRRGQRLRVHTPEDAALAMKNAAADSSQIAALKVRVRPSRRHHRGGGGSVSGPSHIVRQGETLSQIASKYGVSVQSLRRANGLRGSVVRSGQRLRLPG
jgi:LysM repeat protein